ncbi:MAG: pentapeptide repeat-containing protein [Leptolyngbyaceae cyanobacterium bins.302]|nr:pentapeptide repeat-containing protein [Leptolyngbyaceae cyanobacterium bins.302]
MWNWNPRPKPPPPSEEQIRAKVYELWKARGFVGSSPDEDRLKAIALLQEAAATPGHKHRLQDWGNKDDREFALKVKQFHWERLKTVISAFGLAATIFAGVGLYLSYHNGQEQQRLAQEEKQLNTERLMTDRFSKAVEQLGNKEITVRIGGVYALERIAKDSPKDHWTVMEVLTAFVRERSPNRQPAPGTSKSQPPKGKVRELPGVPTDVQSALTEIGSRNVSKETEAQRLDLSRTNLAGAFLDGVNLQGAFLYSANLQDTNLISANLQKANLSRANLQKANLSRANLQKAFLDNANLEGTFLDNANLEGAFLGNASLEGAILLATDLRNTEKLTQSQLQRAESPLLCNVALPKEIKINPDRDCNRLPQELVKRNSNEFTLESAKKFVDEARKRNGRGRQLRRRMG